MIPPVDLGQPATSAGPAGNDGSLTASSGDVLLDLPGITSRSVPLSGSLDGLAAKGLVEFVLDAPRVPAAQLAGRQGSLQIAHAATGTDPPARIHQVQATGKVKQARTERAEAITSRPRQEHPETPPKTDGFPAEARALERYGTGPWHPDLRKRLLVRFRQARP